MTNEKKQPNSIWILTFFAWIIAVIATLGSLFFSEIMGFIPCVLCWYQRIFMYPLVLIFLVGLMTYDKNTLKYATPFVILGWFVALFHNLLHYGIISEGASPCVQGVPCTTKYINYFHFLTIPMLSFIAFSLIAILLLMLKRKISK